MVSCFYKLIFWDNYKFTIIAYNTTIKCVGVYNYLGDVFKFPDPGFINECIKQYESAPSAYALDIGITSDCNFKGECNKNVVIECNDFWSLGNYGLSPKLYSRGLMLRWRELLDLNKI